MSVAMIVKKSFTPISYVEAMTSMVDLVKDVQEGRCLNTLWFLEHFPVYTAGTSAQESHLLSRTRVNISYTGRGGQWTYHGPGQRIVYIVMTLKLRDIRKYIQCLEQSIIDALHVWGVKGQTIPGRVGVWVDHGGLTKKIAAIGVRVQKWTTSHGFSLNVSPDLQAYSQIIPCGISDAGVTSLAELGVFPSDQELDAVLHQALTQNLRIFCP